MEEKIKTILRHQYPDKYEELHEQTTELICALLGVVGRSEQLPPNCIDGFDDDKFCDRSGECEWCKDIRR